MSTKTKTRAKRKAKKPAAARRKKPAPTPAPAKVSTTGRVRKTFHLDEDLVERLDAAVAACRGAPAYLDLATFAETHLARGVRELERKLNGGRRFPPARIPRGRAPKAPKETAKK